MRIDLGGCYLEIKIVSKRRAKSGRDDVSSIRAKIWIAMLARGISNQGALASAMGVGPWTLSRAIHGTYPNKHVREKLAEMCGVPTSELWPEDA